MLANENLPLAAVEELRAMGHDVAWAAEDCPSAEDEALLAQAERESRILLTQDKDFGYLAFRRGLPAPCGIVLLRVPAIPWVVVEFVKKVLAVDMDLSGLFVVVEQRRIRQRPLPRRGSPPRPS